MDSPAIPHLLVVVLTAVIALAQRQAGRRRSLTFVDYERIADPAALNRWAGTWLLALPLTGLANAALSHFSPGLDPLLPFVLIVVALLVTIRIYLGVPGFRMP